MNLDWTRMKAVVLESDDWGLCAWSPDEQALRVLSDTSVYRSEAGLRYAGSTLESADDVRQLAAVLGQYRGGDGFPPIWQANTVMAAPDYARLSAPEFACDALPLLDFPQVPSRWARPGLWGEWVAAREAGVWWPELHGLHHLPEAAWLDALRRGIDDARRAFEQQSPVCEAVAASGEYDRAEPAPIQRRNLEGAASRFEKLFGRAPTSFCPPDYRWDDALDPEAERLGLNTIQGRFERAGVPFPRLQRAIGRHRFPDFLGTRFQLPPRIAFEPGAGDSAGRLGVDAVHASARRAWERSQPAIVSTHRANYAQLDPSRSERGRRELARLLDRLAGDGATFLTDAEVRSLVERGWSLRPLGDRGALVRCPGGSPGELIIPAPPDAARVIVAEASGSDSTASLESGWVTVRTGANEVLLEWRRS